MQSLLLRITAARRMLEGLLTEDEQRHPVAGRKGGTIEWSIEDPAREIIAHAQDPRAASVAAALSEFQHAVNAVLLEVLRESWPSRFRADWFSSRARRVGRRHGQGAMRHDIDKDSVEAEIVKQIRELLVAVDDFAKIKCFRAYAFMATKVLLREWANRISTPVEVPRALARSRADCEGLRASPVDLKAEEMDRDEIDTYETHLDTPLERIPDPFTVEALDASIDMRRTLDRMRAEPEWNVRVDCMLRLEYERDTTPGQIAVDLNCSRASSCAPLWTARRVLEVVEEVRAEIARRMEA